MKVVVTGTSGRVGRAIHFTLCQQHEVVGIDQSPASSTSNVGDIRDADFLKRSFYGANSVIHAAALHAPHVGRVSDKQFQIINVDATARIAELAKFSGVKKLVFTSTTALYGSVTDNRDAAAWINEYTTPEPVTIYHKTKLEAENLLQSEACENFSVVVLRLSKCFPEPAPQMSIYRMHRGVDARDVARGHELAMLTEGSVFRRYILSGKTPFMRTDCKELKHDAKSVIRSRCSSIFADFANRGWELPEAIDRVYDSSKAIKELAWNPRYGALNVLRLYDEGHSEVLPPQAIDSNISE